MDKRQTLESWYETVEGAVRVVVPEVLPEHLMVVLDGSTLQMCDGEQSVTLELPGKLTPEAATMREFRQGTEVVIPKVTAGDPDP